MQSVSFVDPIAQVAVGLKNTLANTTVTNEQMAILLEINGLFDIWIPSNVLLRKTSVHFDPVRVDWSDRIVGWRYRRIG